MAAAAQLFVVRARGRGALSPCVPTSPQSRGTCGSGGCCHRRVCAAWCAVPCAPLDIALVRRTLPHCLLPSRAPTTSQILPTSQRMARARAPSKRSLATSCCRWRMEPGGQQPRQPGACHRLLRRQQQWGGPRSRAGGGAAGSFQCACCTEQWSTKWMAAGMPPWSAGWRWRAAASSTSRCGAASMRCTLGPVLPPPLGIPLRTILSRLLLFHCTRLAAAFTGPAHDGRAASGGLWPAASRCHRRSARSGRPGSQRRAAARVSGLDGCRSQGSVPATGGVCPRLVPAPSRRWRLSRWRLAGTWHGAAPATSPLLKP